MVACCRVHAAGGFAVTRITERMMRAGSFTIDLKPETPESVRSVIRAAVGQDADGTSSPTHGHFVVTVARLPVDSVTAPGGIYTGRLVAQEGRNSFSGVGLAGWLGVNGQTGPRVKTRTAAARDAQAIVSISLANGITAGTITPAGGPTVQESEFGMVTYSERLSAMARQLGHEWHVNAAGQLNVADAADLYPVTPAVMFTDMTKQLASVDGGIRLVDSDARAPKIQAGQRASVTRAVLTLEPPTTVDTAAATVAYDIDGNVAALHRHIDHLDGTATTGAAIAAEVQGRFGSPEADFGVRVNGDRWRLFVNPGELCYAYFPTAGIRDITNLVDIGGTTFPRLLRIQQVDWSPSEGDGVYFVPAPGQGDTIDLSDWFVPGTGGSVVVGVGNGDADVVESVAVARWSESERLQPRGGGGGGGAVPDPLLLSDGSAGAPTYSFSSDPDTGIYRDGADSISFTTGGVQRLDIDGGGIKGKVVFAAPYGSEAAPGFSFDGDPDTGIYRQNTNEIGFATGGTENLRLTGSNLRMASATSTIYNVGYYRGASATGTVSSPTYSWDGDSQTGMYRNGTSTIAWSLGGLRKMQLSPDRLYLFGGTGATSYIGPINTSYFYMYTGSNAFYFNKGVRVDTGIIGSHNENLQLTRAGTTKMTMTTSTTINYQQFKIDGPNVGTSAKSWTSSQFMIESLNSSGSDTTNSLVQMTLHNDRYGVAPLIRNFGVEGESVGFANNANTAFIPIRASAFTVSSTIRIKQDIEAVEDADAIALAEKFLLTSFLPKVRPGNVHLSERFTDVNERWVASSEERTALTPRPEDWDSHDHDCCVDPCAGDADTPCQVTVNDTRRFGGLAEWWGEVSPEQVNFDGEGIADSIDVDQVATTALGATGALSRKLTAAMETIDSLQSRLAVLEQVQ